MIATYDEAVEQIAQSVFATMLGIDLMRVELSAHSDSDMLLAVVHIAGNWTGSVVLALSPELAKQSAMAMLSVASDEVNVADQHDVASELVNMVGGNLEEPAPRSVVSFAADHCLRAGIRPAGPRRRVARRPGPGQRNRIAASPSLRQALRPPRSELIEPAPPSRQ